MRRKEDEKLEALPKWHLCLTRSEAQTFASLVGRRCASRPSYGWNPGQHSGLQLTGGDGPTHHRHCCWLRALPSYGWNPGQHSRLHLTVGDGPTHHRHCCWLRALPYFVGG